MSKVKLMAILCGILISQTLNAQSQNMRVVWNFCDANGSNERAYEDYCKNGTIYLKNKSLFGVTNTTPNGYPIPNTLTGQYTIRIANGPDIGLIPASQWPYNKVYAFQVPNYTFDYSIGLNFMIEYNEFGMDFAEFPSHYRTLYLKTHNPSGTINAGPDQTLCEGSSISVTPSGGSGYSWSPAMPSVATILLGPTTTTYTLTGNVTITTPHNTITCPTTDAMTITVNPKPKLLLWYPQDYCTATPMPVLTNVSGHAGYVWSKNDVVLAGEVSNSLNTATYGYGTYRLTAQNAYGCRASTSTQVNLSPSAFANLSADFASVTTNNSSALNISCVASQTSGEHQWLLYVSNAAGDLLSFEGMTLWSSSTSAMFTGLPLGQYYAVIHKIRATPCGEVRSLKRLIFETARRNMAVPENNRSEDAGMLVYPNPSADVFTVDFNKSISGQIEIIDLSGKKIQSDRLTDVSSYRLDLSGYAKGIYTLNITVDGVSQSKKIVLQ